jgi:hypothetical protein
MIIFELKDISTRQTTRSLCNRDLVKVNRIGSSREKRRNDTQAHHDETNKQSISSYSLLGNTGKEMR